MLNAGANPEASSRRQAQPIKENTMYAFRTAAPNRSLSVANVVTALVAGWFFLAAGTMVAEAATPRAESASAGQFSLTPEGRLKLTVVAKRPAVQTASARPAAKA
jgi:hypothetical protein